MHKHKHIADVSMGIGSCFWFNYGFVNLVQIIKTNCNYLQNLMDIYARSNCLMDLCRIFILNCVESSRTGFSHKDSSLIGRLQEFLYDGFWSLRSSRSRWFESVLIVCAKMGFILQQITFHIQWRPSKTQTFRFSNICFFFFYRITFETNAVFINLKWILWIAFGSVDWWN